TPASTRPLRSSTASSTRTRTDTSSSRSSNEDATTRCWVAGTAASACASSLRPPAHGADMPRNRSFRVYLNDETMLRVYSRRLGIADRKYDRGKADRDIFVKRYQNAVE